MRTIKWREEIDAGTLVDKEVIELILNKNFQTTINMFTTGTNHRIKVEYVFETDGTPLSITALGGGTKKITDCTAADPAVYECTTHGYLVGDIVTVKGRRFADGIRPDSWDGSTPAATFLSDYEVERGTITAVGDANHFTIREHSTSGASSFAGAGDATYDGHKVLIAEIDLTQNTLNTVTYAFKYGQMIITRGETGSTAGAGLLRIDATSSGIR